MKFIAGMLTGILGAFAFYAFSDTDSPQGAFWFRLSEQLREAKTVIEPSKQDLLPQSHPPETAVQLQTVFEPQRKPGPKQQPEQESEATLESKAEPIPLPVVPDHRADEFQVAWIPFASETSATGFAEKLSHQLQRDFEIIKRHAGNYEVGFRYSTETERDRVLVAIESITGYRVPHNS